MTVTSDDVDPLGLTSASVDTASRSLTVSNPVARARTSGENVLPAFGERVEQSPKRSPDLPLVVSTSSLVTLAKLSQTAVTLGLLSAFRYPLQLSISLIGAMVRHVTYPSMISRLAPYSCHQRCYPLNREHSPNEGMILSLSCSGARLFIHIPIRLTSSAEFTEERLLRENVVEMIYLLNTLPESFAFGADDQINHLLSKVCQKTDEPEHRRYAMQPSSERGELGGVRSLRGWTAYQYCHHVVSLIRQAKPLTSERASDAISPDR